MSSAEGEGVAAATEPSVAAVAANGLAAETPSPSHAQGQGQGQVAFPIPTPANLALPSSVTVSSHHLTHIAYLHAWPLIGKLGTGEPFAIKKLDFESELSLLFNTLNEAHKSIRLRMEVATSDNLLRLLTMGCRAIHYTGHGLPSCLAFEDDEGRMHPMDPAQLKELLEAGRTASSVTSPGGRKSGVEFVFVCACHSEAAGQAFVAAGVPHVIAVKTDAAVCDRASQIFMKHFYLALLVGHTVRASFDIGQKAVRYNSAALAGQADEPRKFLLLPENADHEQTLFTDIAAGRWIDASTPAAPHTLPAIPDNFLGRNFVVQRVIGALTKKRLVTLTGKRGIGKSSVAVAAARYIWKRKHFDGVFWVDLRKLNRSQTLDHDQDTDQDTTSEGEQEGHQRHGSVMNGDSDGPAAFTSPSKPSRHRLHHSLSTLVSQACQLDLLHRNPAKLFASLRCYTRLLVILDGADAILPRAEEGMDEAWDTHAHGHAHGHGHGEGVEGVPPANPRRPHSTSSSHTFSPHTFSSPAPTTPHDLRTFISSFLSALPTAKLLVTSNRAVDGVSEVVEAVLEVKPLAPPDAAQLFYDLRPRDILLSEFDCDDPKKAAIKLSEHPALKLLAGHPRRIFNAVPLLRDRTMADLPPLIEAQIRREQAAENRHMYSPTVTTPRPPTRSGTQTPEPSHPPPPYTPPSATAAAAALAPSSTSPSFSSPVPVPVPMHPSLPDQQQLFGWFGGHGSNRSAQLVSMQHPPLTEEAMNEWTNQSLLGMQFWTALLNNVHAMTSTHSAFSTMHAHGQIVPWSDAVELSFNQFLASRIGSNERGLDSTDLATLAAKLESHGSPRGYVNLSAVASFWRDWLSLCETIRKVLPYWLCHSPTRIISGWCSRPTVNAMLTDPFTHKPKPVGTCVVRLSESMMGSIAIGFVDQSQQILHTLVLLQGDSYVLKLTDGDRRYSSLGSLLIQCRPFQTIYPNVAKLSLLNAAGDVLIAPPTPHGMGMAMGMGMGNSNGRVETPPHVDPSAMPALDQLSLHHASSRFQQFPNNAPGGGVGLTTPPPPGAHGLAPSAASLTPLIHPAASISAMMGQPNHPMPTQQEGVPHAEHPDAQSKHS